MLAVFSDSGSVMDRDEHHRDREQAEIIHRFDHTQFDAVLKFLNKLADGSGDERLHTAILNSLQAINHQGVSIMSAIADFAAKQKAYNDRTGAAIDGVVADIKALNDKITELQNSAGQVTPEDQALIDDLQVKGEALASKAEALDAQIPPPPPPG